MDLEQSHAEFPTTQWTLIEALRAKDHPQHEEAAGILVSRYWPPVYAYLRRAGQGREEATETTQAFFVNVVLKRRLFDRAEPRRGRLRALLLTSLKHYLEDCHRRQTVRRADLTISLDHVGREEAVLADNSTGTVDQTFDRRWAMAVLEAALRRCEQHYRGTGREKHWTAFELHVLQPSITMNHPRPLAQIAEEVGFETPDEVAGALRTVRKRTMTLLREVIAETVADRADQEAEYRFVVSMLS